MKNIIICILMYLFMNISSFAIEVTGTPPEFTGNVAFTTELEKVFDKFLGEINDNVRDISLKPEQLIRAWGNSAVFASHGGTHRAFGGYKLFTLTLGPMLGVQLPVSPFRIFSEFDNLTNKLQDEGDINLGINPQLNLHLGINTSFLLKNLYLGLRVGYINFPNLIDGFSFKTTTIGLTANYQLVSPVDLASLIVWRGVNIGSGFIFNNSKMNFSLPMEAFSEPLDGTYTNAILQIDPRIFLDLNIKTYTIPLEVMTAIKLLFVNIPIGLGVDLAFGKSDMKIGMDADINVIGSQIYNVNQTRPGSLSVNAGGEMSPSFMNLKLMSGIGFVFGPVVIDIPITYYFINNGFNIGVNIGVTF